MPTKKFNHYIPKLILKHWVVQGTKYKGVYVYEIKEDKITFYSAEGKKAFSFAAVNNIYIPTINSKRKINLEDWLGGAESILDKTIFSLISEKHVPLFKNKSQEVRFLIALISLKHRNRYNLEKVHEHLLKNVDQKTLITGGDPNRDDKILLLENIVNITTEEVGNFNSYEITVHKCQNKELIMCDRPYIENIDGYDIVPITNRAFISIKKTTGMSYYQSTPATDRLIDSLNFALADLSRYWIMATNEDLLKEYISKAKEHKTEQETQFVKTKNLKSGFIY